MNLQQKVNKSGKKKDPTSNLSIPMKIVQMKETKELYIQCQKKTERI